MYVPAIESEAQRFFELLDNPVLAVRAIRRKDHPDQRLAIGYFSDSCEFADTVCGLSSAGEGPELYQGVFTTVNRLHEEYRDAVRGVIETGRAVGEKAIARIRIVPLDIDPTRDHPDGGKVCSSDSEHQTAIDAANQAIEIARSNGWPEPALIDSGNGSYCFWRVDLPNTPESRALIEAVIGTFSKLLDSNKIHVDGSVGDPSRVFRIPGTINRKSPHTDERPNRTARIISAPEFLKIVTEEQLRAFSAGYIAPPRPEKKKEQNKEPLPADIHEQRVQAVETWMARAGHPPGQRKENSDHTVVPFKSHCPIKGREHTDGDAAVLVYRNGGRGFKCFHEKCRNKHFKDLEKQFKLPFADIASECASAHATGRTDRVFKDPLLLADRHLAKWTMRDGTHTLAVIWGEVWRFDRLGWVPVKPNELDPWIRETAQEVFDRHAEILSWITGDDHKPVPIRGQLVADTYKAMHQRCKRAVSITAQAPFWLEPHKDWEPEDLLVFKNGILNVRRYIEDQPDYLIDVTPKLFFEHQAGFDFDPEAMREPAEWLRFLKSLDRDDDWFRFLQEICGYCLWQRCDLQKFFVFVGPSRCGKGTITGVLENLVGGKLAVCGLGLKDFVDQFGLEPAIAKRLAFVPEMRLPSHGVHDIVSNLKAITGGDLIQVKRKTIKNLSMRLRMKIIMSTNEFVPLPDNSGALQARMLPLRFTKSFFGKEDTKLAEKLASEYPAILLWALDGLKRLWNNDGHFTLPKSTQEELRQLIEASAPLHAFVQECCVVDQSVACHSPSLYEVYKLWRERHQPESDEFKNNQFADALRCTVPSLMRARTSKVGDTHCQEKQIMATEHDRKKRAECWLGIAPKPEWCFTRSEEAA